MARLGIVDDIEVRRRTPITDPSSPQNAYGDDGLEYIDTVDSRRHWVKGWLHSTPAQVQEVDSGAVVTINTYTLRVPVGTDIENGDEVVLGGDTYVVSSTNKENTWTGQVIIDCNLRKRE